MTVRELILQLTKFDQSFKVFIRDEDGDYEEIASIYLDENDDIPMVIING